MPKKKKSLKSDISYSSVEQLADGLRSKFGDSTLLKEDSDTNVKFIPTCLTSLDLSLGGGIPLGRVIEIFGPESAGKTTLALHIIGVFQRMGLHCMFVDAEYAYDKKYAASYKVDNNKLLLSQPDYGEQGLEMVEEAVRSGVINLIVVDSVAALVPKAEIEGEMGDSHMGLQARMMSQALRKLTGIISKKECSVIFINQLRQKIGIMFGNPETTTGGNALKFYASQRIDVRKIGRIPEDKNVPPKGIRQRVKVVKNKVAPPFRECELNLMFGKGYDAARDLFDIANDFGVIKNRGPMYEYGEITLGKGIDAAIEGIKKMEKADRKQLRADVKKAYIGD